MPKNLAVLLLAVLLFLAVTAGAYLVPLGASTEETKFLGIPHTWYWAIAMAAAAAAFLIVSNLRVITINPQHPNVGVPPPDSPMSSASPQSDFDRDYLTQLIESGEWDKALAVSQALDFRDADWLCEVMGTFIVEQFNSGVLSHWLRFRETIRTRAPSLVALVNWHGGLGQSTDEEEHDFGLEACQVLHSVSRALVSELSVQTSDRQCLEAALESRKVIPARLAAFSLALLLERGRVAEDGLRATGAVILDWLLADKRRHYDVYLAVAFAFSRLRACYEEQLEYDSGLFEWAEQFRQFENWLCSADMAETLDHTARASPAERHMAAAVLSVFGHWLDAENRDKAQTWIVQHIILLEWEEPFFIDEEHRVWLRAVANVFGPTEMVKTFTAELESLVPEQSPKLSLVGRANAALEYWLRLTVSQRLCTIFTFALLEVRDDLLRHWLGIDYSEHQIERWMIGRAIEVQGTRTNAEDFALILLREALTPSDDA